MTQRTPTAEEVLGLYGEFRHAANTWIKTDNDDGSLMKSYMAATEKWERAYQQWQASQGPVTREWFVERFGADKAEPRRGVQLKCSPDGMWLITRMSTHFHHVRLHNPTRSDIETLVRVLGGSGD